MLSGTSPGGMTRRNLASATFCKRRISSRVISGCSSTDSSLRYNLPVPLTEHCKALY